MGLNETTCCKPKKIFNQQGARNVLPGYLKNCMTFVLTALLILGIWVTPSVAELLTVETTTCSDCHRDGDNWLPIHNGPHPSSPPGGWVQLFYDTDHDDAGWRGDKPYFDIAVDCSTCHTSDLRAIHANDCFTCHDKPEYESVIAKDEYGNSNWTGGCGQCHQDYHENSVPAHFPWESAWNGSQDCNVCHDGPTWNVTQSNCNNCHASYGPGDTTPPVTITNAKATYIGPAIIDFSIRDNTVNPVPLLTQQVGMGRTFYQLDNGPELAGSDVFVDGVGSHVLEYYSVDQSGNTESTLKSTSFTIIADTNAPVTTLNAQNSYTNISPTITFTAEDDGELGVKETYCSINGGTPVAGGSSVTIPKPSTTTTYELTCWSVDYSGNIEPVDAHNTKSITINVIANAPLTLIWWNSDTTGSPCPSNDYDAAAFWKIERVNTVTGTTTLVKNWNGSWNNPPAYASCWNGNNWSGINTENLLVTSGPYKYKVSVKVWYNEEGFADQWESPPYLITLPAGGAVLRY